MILTWQTASSCWHTGYGRWEKKNIFWPRKRNAWKILEWGIIQNWAKSIGFLRNWIISIQFLNSKSLVILRHPCLKHLELANPPRNTEFPILLPRRISLNSRSKAQTFIKQTTKNKLSTIPWYWLVDKDCHKRWPSNHPLPNRVVKSLHLLPKESVKHAKTACHATNSRNWCPP